VTQDPNISQPDAARTDPYAGSPSAAGPDAGEATTSPAPPAGSATAGGPAVSADGISDVISDGADPDGTEPGDAGDAALEAELGDVRKLVAGLTEDLQRLQAEYVNYKRRVDRDRELVLQNAKFAVLSAFLPVLDDVDRAREHGELEGGFKAVAESLELIVAGQGLQKYGARGDEFDPRIHEALMHAHSKDVTTTTCQDIVSAGYKMGDRVMRPARVTVVDPEPGSEPSDGATANPSVDPSVESDR
jgi:molecular chaperone GrpE